MQYMQDYIHRTKKFNITVISYSKSLVGFGMKEIPEEETDDYVVIKHKSAGNYCRMVMRGGGVTSPCLLLKQRCKV
jgi:hypothetical protein